MCSCCEIAAGAFWSQEDAERIESKQQEEKAEAAREQTKVGPLRPLMQILGEILNFTGKDKTDSMQGFAVRSLALRNSG